MFHVKHFGKVRRNCRTHMGIAQLLRQYPVASNDSIVNVLLLGSSGCERASRSRRVRCRQRCSSRRAIRACRRSPGPAKFCERRLRLKAALRVQGKHGHAARSANNGHAASSHGCDALGIPPGVVFDTRYSNEKFPRVCWRTRGNRRNWLVNSIES